MAAQLRDVGLNVRRTILPGATFWQNWQGYPFSATQWNHRPLEVQALSLAYRSGAVWNETGYANPEFDALLDRAMAISDAETRRPIMHQIEVMLRGDGVIIHALLAQAVQPPQRHVDERRKASITRNSSLQDRVFGLRVSCPR